MLKYLVVVCAITASAMCRNTASNYNAINSDQLSDKLVGSTDKNDESFFNWMDISSMYNKYVNYSSSDISVFLKMKLLSSIDSVANKNFELGNGIRFVRDSSNVDDETSEEFNENAILKTLPRTLNEKEDILSSLIWKRIGKLMRSHTLQVSKTIERMFKQMIRLMRYISKRVVPHFILDSLLLFKV